VRSASAVGCVSIPSWSAFPSRQNA
jgi:hypothetical protein